MHCYKNIKNVMLYIYLNDWLVKVKKTIFVKMSQISMCIIFYHILLYPNILSVSRVLSAYFWFD